MVLYLIAMEEEAKDIVSSFKLVENDIVKIYQKENTLIGITNVGKVNAAFASTYILSKYENIKIIVNVGFAGAYGKYQIGDYVLVDQAIYHDFDLTPFNYKMGQVPNIKEELLTDRKFLTLFYDLKRTKLFTGDQFLNKEITDDFLVDMEGTALYHIAHLMKKEIFSIKVVSDVIGQKEHLEEYNKFEQEGSKNLLDLFNMIEVRLNEKGIDFIK